MTVIKYIPQDGIVTGAKLTKSQQDIVKLMPKGGSGISPEKKVGQTVAPPEPKEDNPSALGYIGISGYVVFWLA